MIQESAKPSFVRWKVEKCTFHYGTTYLYELFETNKNTIEKKVPLYWLTHLDGQGNEKSVGHITTKNVESLNKFIITVKQTIIANKKGVNLQKATLSTIDKYDSQTRTALQHIIDNYEKRILNLELVLADLENTTSS